VHHSCRFCLQEADDKTFRIIALIYSMFYQTKIKRRRVLLPLSLSPTFG
jgi:hypothetical protein